MKKHDEMTIQEHLDNGAVLRAAQLGTRRAVRMHKLLGNPVATFRDGKVVWIPPEEIQIDEPVLHEARSDVKE